MKMKKNKIEKQKFLEINPKEPVNPDCICDEYGYAIGCKFWSYPSEESVVRIKRKKYFQERNARIVSMYENGCDIKSICYQFGLKRDRVKQIISRC